MTEFGVPERLAARRSRSLGALGRAVRTRAKFLLMVFALALGILRELPWRSSWRRPVRAELARSLRQALAGGMLTTIVVAALVGIAMVYQALFWLGEAGEETLIGSILVAVLVREVAPVLVGLIMLGRSGTVAAAEVGTLELGGQVDQLTAQGIDPFTFLVLPRAAAFALAAYTLGMAFVLVALAVGFGAGAVAGGVRMSLWQFMATVLGAMQPADFAVFPTKMLALGVVVALSSVLTGLSIRHGEEIAGLLPRTFARGMVAIMLTSISLSLAI